VNSTALQAAVAKQFYSIEGYLIELDSDEWKLSKDVTIPVTSLTIFLGQRKESCLRVLEFYARTAGPWHTRNVFSRLLHYCRQMQESELFTVESLISYRSSLTKQTEWYLSVMRGAIRQWSRLGYPGISDEVIVLLDKWVLKGNRKGFAVQSMCPEDGPLTDMELQGVIGAIIEGFAGKRLSLEDTCMVLTLAMTGRRPGQVSALKIKDLISAPPNGYWISFPRAKQRDASWRSSFNRFSVVEDLWLLLEQQADAVKTAFSKANGRLLPRELEQELPLFPANSLPSNEAEIRDLVHSDRLHAPTSAVASAAQRVAKTILVISERTGEPISLNPNRFRYTLGTNLAREGRGVYVIAEALDHSDTQNAGVYIKNIPDIVERIDKAVALQLAPYAQAFRGVIVDSESSALRGDDPTSRISTGWKNVGTCGSYGFCGALAPVACYTCSHFQPWIDGPHEEVLEGLLAERDKVRDVSGDIKIASINDRLIMAVGDVVNRCKRDRLEMNNA